MFFAKLSFSNVNYDPQTHSTPFYAYLHIDHFVPLRQLDCAPKILGSKILRGSDGTSCHTEAVTLDIPNENSFACLSMVSQTNSRLTALY